MQNSKNEPGFCVQKPKNLQNCVFAHHSPASMEAWLRKDFFQVIKKGQKNIFQGGSNKLYTISCALSSAYQCGRVFGAVDGIFHTGN